MKNIKSFLNNLSKINKSTFDYHAIELFKFQSKYNLVYKAYLDSLNFDPEKVNKLTQIPFLPIEFFKYHSVKTNDWETEIVFESSGTTQILTSKHYVPDLDFYHEHAREIFEDKFGRLEGMSIFALLPSYLERKASSLVSMVDSFISATKSNRSGFYLDNTLELLDNLTESKEETFLFGVTFALLDLAENYDVDLSHVTVIETGGMKGRREEITKQELYETLKSRLGIKKIYSEYGMTELLSQAYGKDGRFPQPSSMKIFIRDINDPFDYVNDGKTGGINIIDLANAHSCSFIETKDLGRINQDETFEVLGRFDNSDLRGCNLLVS
jgi:phenylacetate-coenzyme A ligase PaaK-like adenylate-forming protein